MAGGVRTKAGDFRALLIPAGTPGCGERLFEYHSGGRNGGLQERRGARTSRPFSGAIQEAGDFLNEACGIFVHRHVAAALHD